MKFNALPFLALFFLNACFFPLQHFAPGSDLEIKANPRLKLGFDVLKQQSSNHKVLIAIIDSGVDYNHTKLSNHIRLTRDFKGVGLDILGRDAWPHPIILNPISGDAYEDFLGDSDHGTHVASLALLGGYVKDFSGKVLDSEKLLGLIPVRALPLDDEGLPPVQSGLSREEELKQQELLDLLIVKKIVSYLNQALVFSVKEDAHIANLSLGIGGSKLHTTAKKKLQDLVQKDLYSKMIGEWSDVLFVFAAGNDAIEVVDGSYPASLKGENLITVGALNKNDEIAEYTNFGALVDVYMQGSEINGLVPNGGRAKMSGTSMAAPLVSNLAGKILLVAPCLKAREVKSLILRTSELKNLKVSDKDEIRSVRVAKFKAALKEAREVGKRCVL